MTELAAVKPGVILLFFLSVAGVTRAAIAAEPDRQLPVIPVVVQPDAEQGLTVALEPEASTVGLRVINDGDAWATRTPANRTRFRIRLGETTKGVFELPVVGTLSLATMGTSAVAVSRVDPQRAAYNVAIDALNEPIKLSLRASDPTRVRLVDGFGTVSKGVVGAQNEGKVEGTLHYEFGARTDFLVLELRWAGTRLFGWVGGKSRTVKIPVRRIERARFTRQATMAGTSVELGETTLLELEWKIPPDRSAKAQRRGYSKEFATIAARIPAEDRPTLGVLDFFLKRRARRSLPFACCYADSSLSAFLRFSRSAEAQGDRCSTSHRCSPKTLDWLNR